MIPASHRHLTEWSLHISCNRKSAADFDSDMKRAKELGIDAFALNIGVDRVDPFTDTQLEFAYQSAANNDMKVFISFDFNWWKEDSEASQVGQKIAKFGGKPAQLMMDGKIFVSSFAGDRVDVNAIRSAAGRPIYWAPNYHRPESADISKVDALLNWMAWPNDGNNKAPKPGRLVTVQDGDKNDRPHNGWMELARPFIAAYKAGASSVNEYIKEEQLIYWYRPSPRGANCDATDTCMVPADNSSGNYFMGRPNGWESMDDVVFVVSMLKSPANIQISSGNSQQVFEAKAGATAFKAPMGVGKQSFAVVRDNKMVLAGTSPKDIIEGCVCGIYNFNAFDPLQPDSLSRFAQGLKVQCEAKPSLKPPPPPPSTINPNPPTNPPTNSPPTNNPPPPTNNPPPPSTTQNPPPQPPPTNNPPPPNQPPPNQPPGTVCTGGTGENNYKGLCHFCCHFGYCPPGPCTCNAYGAPIPAPPSTGQRGVPADGMDDSYKGLCSFACDHGYCPQGACKLV
ncbi:unnamed protein product [Aspergillus oryzae]|uniref:Unnamed protein product n=1 Tax=Aspergillus oryzae TaxID=5062 RepID=A0AAN4YB31_ASPOZ|nr:unnamed protein product [Aspergillus oryzae]